MKSYSIHDIVKIIIKDLLVIIVLGLLFGLALWGYAKHKQSVTYTAERNILVGHTGKNRHIHYQNSQVNADLSKTQTYSDIIQDRLVTNQAYKKLPKSVKKNVSREDVKSDIHVDNHPQSLVLTIKVHAKTPKQAAAIANSTAKATQQQLPKVDASAGKVKPLAPASSKNAEMKKSISAKKYGILGLAFGVLLGMVISFVNTSWKHLMK